MSHSSRFDCELRTSLPATLPAVEEFFVEFRRTSRQLMNRANCFATELLVREALTNAVVHGCHEDPGKLVRCSMRLRGRVLFIAVGHDGGGFDWRAAAQKEQAFSDCSGRGLQILHLYANRVRYNETGNVVTMIKRFDEEKGK